MQSLKYLLYDPLQEKFACHLLQVYNNNCITGYLGRYRKIEIFILYVVLVLYKIPSYSGLPDFVLTSMGWKEFNIAHIRALHGSDGVLSPAHGHSIVSILLHQQHSTTCVWEIHVLFCLYVYIYTHIYICVCVLFSSMNEQNQFTPIFQQTLLKQLGPSHLRLCLDQGFTIAMKLTSGQITLG